MVYKLKLFRALREDVTRARSALGRLVRGGDGAPERYVGRLEHAYERSWGGCPCVFVLSTGRVGSQTLTALFALSPEVAAEHEPFPRLVKASFDAYLEGDKIAGSPVWREVIYASRDDLVCEANRRGKIYVETNNRLTYLAPVLAECFPASKFIHLHRDPFEVVRSAMRRGYYDSHNWDFARVRPRPGEALSATWDELPRIEKCAWFWARVNEEAHGFLADLPRERALDLRSDLLFAGDEATLRRVFAFAGVDLPRWDLIEKVLGRKLNASPSDCSMAVEGFGDAEREAIWRHVGGIAECLGYRPGERGGSPRSGARASSRSAGFGGFELRLAFGTTALM